MTPRDAALLARLRALPPPPCWRPSPRSTLSLRLWWEQPDRYPWSSYVSYTTAAGSIEVYARRNIVDRRVLEIANVSTTYGWGAAWSLYTHFTRHIPAVAEQVLHPQLDAMLQRWGWTTVYRDIIGTPTRVNPAFVRLCPRAADYDSPGQALYRLREQTRGRAA